MSTPAPKPEPERQPAEGSRASAIAQGTDYLRGFGSPMVRPRKGDPVPFAPGLSFTDAECVSFVTQDGKILAAVREVTSADADAIIDSVGHEPSTSVRSKDRIYLIWRFRTPQNKEDVSAALRAFTGYAEEGQLAPIVGSLGAQYALPEDEKGPHPEDGFPAYEAADLLVGFLRAAKSHSPVSVSGGIDVAAWRATGEADDAEPFKSGDAEFVGGKLSPEVLDLPLKIGFGRSKDDKRWPAKAITFEQMLSTLATHTPGDKDGPAFIQGEAIKNDRKARAISGLYVVGLDVDSGIKLDWVTHRIQHDLKLTSIIYTTHSHLSKQTLILQSSFQKYAKKRKLPLEPTSETMRQYMMDEKNWEKWVVDSIEVEDDAKHEAEGIVYVLNHAPIPKFRILFPLLEPYIISKQKGLNQSDAIDRWKGKLLGLSKTIGLPIDESCLDPSRLFYLPRHKKGAGFSIFVTSGAALNFDNVIEIERKRDNGPIEDDVFAAAAAELGAKHGLSIEGFNLKFWAKHNAHQFDICKLFADKMPERIRHETSNDKFEVECPFDDNHSNAGDAEDRACYVISAHADNSDSPFIWGCQHASCKGRDRLDFVAKAVNDQWFTIADLEDPSHMVFTVEGEVEVKTAKTPESIVAEQIEKVRGIDLATASEAELSTILKDGIEAGLHDPFHVGSISIAMDGAANFKPRRRADYIKRELARVHRAKKQKETNATGDSAKWPADPFFAKDGMIYKRIPRKDDDPAIVEICDAFTVIGQSENEKGQDRRKHIKFKDGSADRVASFPLSKLQSTSGAAEIRQHVVDMGLNIIAQKDAKDGFEYLLSKAATPHKFLCYSLPGWHDAPDGRKVYVTPAGIVIDGPTVPTNVSVFPSLIEDAGLVDRQPGGTFEGWFEAVEMAGKAGMFYWGVGLYSAFCSPLGSLLNMAPCGAFMSGESSSGKSTALRMPASAWGSILPSRGLLWNLNMTAGAAEARLVRGHGSTVQFDEVRLMDPGELMTLGFAISGGSGRGRLQRNAVEQKTRLYNVFVLFSSERTLAQIVEGDMRARGRPGKIDPGLAVRLPDINVTGYKQDVPDVVTALDVALLENYGHAGPKFIAAMFKAGYVAEPGRLRDEIEELRDRLCAGGGSSLRRRAAIPFALLWKAGDIAKAAGVIPAVFDVEKDVRTAWEVYEKSAEGDALKPGARAIEQTRKSFVTGKDVLFQPTDGNVGFPRDIKGYYDDSFVYVLCEWMADVAGGGVVTEKAAVDALEAAGILVRQGVNNRISTNKIPGVAPLKHYKLDRDKLLAYGEAKP